MIKSFKDIKNRKEIYADKELVAKLQKEFPTKTREAINKACLITKNSYELCCILLKSDCKLDPNKFDSNDLQVESDYLYITLYKNGIKIDKKFFDYSEESNRHILEKLQKGEIDSKYIGNDSDGYAKIIDKSKENYQINKHEEDKIDQEKEMVEEVQEKKKGFTIGELRKMNKK